MANCVSRIKLVLSVVIRRRVSEGEGLVEKLQIANCELRIANCPHAACGCKYTYI